MKAFLWRIVIAAICFVIFVTVVPLLFQVLGIGLAGPLWQLIKICMAFIALLYVIFGPDVPVPF